MNLQLQLRATAGPALSSPTAMPSGARNVASLVNALSRFDAVIHNAAVGYREGPHVTADGLPHVFAINTLAACVLTALIERPKRLVYLSSGLHHGADANLDDILLRK